MQGMKPETLTKRRVTGADDPLFVKSLDIYRTSFFRFMSSGGFRIFRWRLKIRVFITKCFWMKRAG